jgi:hypothetical protein
MESLVSIEGMCVVELLFQKLFFLFVLQRDYLMRTAHFNVGVTPII